MIVLDDQNGALNKSVDGTGSSSASDESSSNNINTSTAHLEAPQAQHYRLTSSLTEHLPPPYSPRNDIESDPLLPYYFQRELSKRATKRFIHALAFAAVFWSLFGVFARSVFIFAFKQPQATFNFPNEDTIRCLDENDWTHTTENIHPQTMKISGINQFYSSAYLEFPPEIDSFFLTSHNFSSRGTVGISTTESSPNGIQVEITSFYLTEDIRDKYKICVLSRGGNSRGLGIMRTSTNSPIRSLDSGFGFGIRFPYDKKTRPRHYGYFESDIPRLFYDSENTLGDIDFERFTVNSKENAIILNSISADTIELTTENALITGTIHASKSVTMRTTNSYIETAIDLQSYSNETASKVDIRTEASSVSANVRLSIGGELEALGQGGFYNINASCPGAHLNLRVMDAPSSSILQVGTISGSVLINLPPTFEGQWNLTSPVHVVTVNPESTDPTGRGRFRQYEEIRDKNGEAYAGLSWWGDTLPPSAAESYVKSESSEAAYMHFG